MFLAYLNVPQYIFLARTLSYRNNHWPHLKTLWFTPFGGRFSMSRELYKIWRHTLRHNIVPKTVFLCLVFFFVMCGILFFFIYVLFLFHFYFLFLSPHWSPRSVMFRGTEYSQRLQQSISIIYSRDKLLYNM